LPKQYWRDPLRHLAAHFNLHRRRVTLEIFSGSGRWSTAYRTAAKRAKVDQAVFELDIRWHLENDLLSIRVQQKVQGWIRAGMIAAVWIGTPCNSFSRARDRPGGPPPLRSNECPKGLAELSEKDSRKVLEGNELARFSIAVFHECRSWKIAAVIENPHSSRLWCMPAFKHARSIRHVEFNWTDFCQDGTPWRKRTAFLSTGLVFGVKLKSEFARTMRQCFG